MQRVCYRGFGAAILMMGWSTLAYADGSTHLKSAEHFLRASKAYFNQSMSLRGSAGCTSASRAHSRANVALIQARLAQSKASGASQRSRAASLRGQAQTRLRAAQARLQTLGCSQAKRSGLASPRLSVSGRPTLGRPVYRAGGKGSASVRVSLKTSRARLAAAQRMCEQGQKIVKNQWNTASAKEAERARSFAKSCETMAVSAEHHARNAYSLARNDASARRSAQSFQKRARTYIEQAKKLYQESSKMVDRSKKVGGLLQQGTQMLKGFLNKKK